MQPLVVMFDVVSFLGFTVAWVYAMRLPLSPGRALELGTKLALVIMMMLYVFVGVSNILEHAGITASLDLFEDYAEVLFVPLFAYVGISAAAAARLRRELAVQADLRVERDFSASMMHASPAGIVLVDEAGHVQFGNERAFQLLGSVAEEAFAGAPVFIERDGALPEPRSLAEIASEPSLDSRRYTVMGLEELRVLAITSAHLAREGVIVSMLDATARVLADRELEQYRRDLEVLVERRTEQLVEANMELEAANTAKKSFLANMSHELRTPLNTILGFSNVLLKETVGPLSDEQKQEVAVIHEAGEQLLTMVDEVLNIAKIEAGHVVIEKDDVDLGSIVGRVAQEFRVAAEDAGVRLTVEIGAGEHCVVTDVGKLLQVLRNLVSNAIKFTPADGEVHVELAGEGDEYSVRVRDTGVGIAPYDQGRVFSAFYQACPPGEIKSQGAGLGLAIVSQLCELIGARVELQSAPGYGSTFTVHIPKCLPAVNA